MIRISIVAKDNPKLKQEMIDAFKAEAFVEFSNGCSIWMRNDGGVLWGSDPYGQDFAINVENWLESSTRKISYWNDDRDEFGNVTK